MHQHYLPEVYLKGFTDPDCPPHYTPYVHVFRAGAWERRSPDNLAKKPDIYTVRDKDGNPMLIYEEYLGKVERGFARAMRETVARRVLPTGDHRVMIAEFAALMMVRLPSQHEGMAEFQKDQAHRFVHQQHETYRDDPARWEARKEELRRDGLIIPDDWTADDAFAPKDVTMRIEIPKEAVLVPAFDMVPDLAQTIHDMVWTFYRTDTRAPFVTSDWPLAPMDPKRPGEYLGLKAREIDLTLPLSASVALHGSWRRHADRFRPATKAIVRAANNRTAIRATEFIVSPKTSFPGAKSIIPRFGRASAG